MYLAPRVAHWAMSLLDSDGAEGLKDLADKPSMIVAFAALPITTNCTRKICTSPFFWQRVASARQIAWRSRSNACKGGCNHGGKRRTGGKAAALVARAWVDPEFRARLLDNGRPPCEELGISFFEDTQLIIVENTEKVHNLLVCTLCSCYPREIIGLPPDWYKLMTRKPLRMWSATASRSKRLAKR